MKAEKRLQQLHQAIEQWRRQRSSRREKIPEGLRGRILALSGEGEISVGRICRVLRLAHQFFPKGQNKSRKPKRIKPEFVEINPFTREPQALDAGSQRLVFQWPGGLRIEVMP